MFVQGGDDTGSNFLLYSAVPVERGKETKGRREALGNTPLSLFALLPLSLFCLTQFVSATLPTEGGEVPLLDPNIFCRLCVGVFFCETVCAGLPCLLQ